MRIKGRRRDKGGGRVGEANQQGGRISPPCNIQKPGAKLGVCLYCFVNLFSCCLDLFICWGLIWARSVGAITLPVAMVKASKEVGVLQFSQK